MGAQRDDPNGPNYDPEAMEHWGPVHEVTLSPFLVGKCEVTQTQWGRIMPTNPSFYRGADLPVKVSWVDCQEFCKKMQLKLPTEAQWEYACRAGTPGPHAGTGRLEEMGWFEENSGDMPHPVGQKGPNQFGLHDTHGLEWCEDMFDASFYATPEAGGLDPVCTADSEDSDECVARSGAFNLPCKYVCSAVRFRVGHFVRHHYAGFRVVAFPAP
jgi:formylglycine-generating enzyme required for sulfatase activity